MFLFYTQINRLVKIIFCKDEAKKYKFFKDKKELSWKTPLHLVAELNFTSVAQTILSHYPGQLYITTNPHAGNDNSRSIPLKLALKRRNDEVSTLMIEHMGSERYCGSISLSGQLPTYPSPLGNCPPTPPLTQLVVNIDCC